MPRRHEAMAQKTAKNSACDRALGIAVSSQWIRNAYDVARLPARWLSHIERRWAINAGRLRMIEIGEAGRRQAATCDVPPDIHPEDFIYIFLRDHPNVGAKAAEQYFRDGNNSCRKLKELLRSDTNRSPDEPFTLLEFASGYGCVTRHLKNVMPRADIVACDIHPQAMDFISSRFNVPVALSKSDPLEFDLGRRFDVVFALSFFSHMPDRTFGPWLKALFRHVSPGGCLIFTTHGQVSLGKIWNNSIDLGPEGFWFASTSEQHDIDVADYGTAIASTAYVTRKIYRNLAAPVALISQGFWWEHQDVYVVARTTE
jgi:SAM-dependent methyltransferase